MWVTVRGLDLLWGRAGSGTRTPEPIPCGGWDTLLSLDVVGKELGPAPSW